jgi:two-component system invasion response regulator UvrY
MKNFLHKNSWKSANNSLPVQPAPALHEQSSKEITIMIVDDHPLIRENWCYILKRDSRFELLGEYGTAETALEMISKWKPDVVLMDINLPGIDGLQATRLIKKSSPATKIIGVSLHTQPIFAEKMMENGASGYVTKTSSREELLNAITAVHKGEIYICQELQTNLPNNQ